MIAQIVFDLPLEGPFDYLVPEHLSPRIAVGMRVKVSFGPRIQIGFTIGIIEKSAITKLKPIEALCDEEAIFNALDLSFARDFSTYYGCSLGESLATILRNKVILKPSIQREHKPSSLLYICPPGNYAARILDVLKKYPKEESRFLVLIPDAFRAQLLSRVIKDHPNIKIGARSSVFESDGQFDCVIMIDDEDSSYKQEQMPMYETRQVLITRSKIFGFDIIFIGYSPSVELMYMVRAHEVKLIEDLQTPNPVTRIVDLTNYKFLPGMISPPVRDALEAGLKAGHQSILILNRRGSYRLTRCVDCSEILKCLHCDSPLIYSRSEGKYLCGHCTYTVPGNTACPKCQKLNWRSMGIGVEQLQSELKKYFNTAKIVSYSGAAKRNNKLQILPEFDILISTRAVLRFQGQLKAQMAAFIDFDAELNRLDMRSAFNAISLASHVRSMASDSVFIQTRNSGHYAIQSLAKEDTQFFYEQDLALRKEFGFSPFKHWIKLNWRGKIEKLTKDAAQEAYHILSKKISANFMVTPPLADGVKRKRDQFRFNVMVQADSVPNAMPVIKSALDQSKRHSRVIVSLNVDP